MARKEGKDVMTKPVAVPLNHYVGATVLSSKNKEKTISKWTRDATSILDALVETVEVQQSLPAQMDALEINPLQTNGNTESQTLYLPIFFPNCATP